MIEAKPLTESECMEINLIPKGIYPFRIEWAIEKNSPRAGAFFSLRLSVTMEDGHSRPCFDAIFFSESMMWKTRHLYKSIKKLDKYETGKYFAEDLNMSEGYVQIEHRLRKDNGEMENYVKDYISSDKEPAPIKVDEDDLPF